MKRSFACVAALLLYGSAAAWNPVQQRPGGAPRWNVSTPVVWNPDGGSLGKWQNTTATTEVADAFAVWGGVETSTISYTMGSQIVDSGGSPVDVSDANFFEVIGLMSNGQNPIIFDNDRDIFDQLGLPNGTLGIAGPLVIDGSGTITKAFAMIQGEWFDNHNQNGELSADQFRGMIVHELGHFSGLGHTSVNNAFVDEGLDGCPPAASNLLETMTPTNHKDSSTLHHDDLVGISALYPTTSFDTTAVRVEGRLFDRTGTQGFNGANVVLRPATANCDSQYGEAQAMQSGANPGEYGGPGTYVFAGLTPNSFYTVLATSITAPGSYTIGGPLPPVLPGPDDFYNGPAEDSFEPPDIPGQVETLATGAAGNVLSGVDIFVNNPGGPGETDSIGSDALAVDRFDGIRAIPGDPLLEDDNSAEGGYGIDGNGQLAWITRFSPTASQLPLRIEQIEILFSETSAPAGRPVRLLVYVDPLGTGDPANATLAHSEETTIQFLDTQSFNVFPLSSPVLVSSGDVYLGAFDLVADPGPENLIAMVDVNSSTGSAFVQVGGTSPGDFAPAIASGLPDWTWMIRGAGSTIPAEGTIRLSWGPPCNDDLVPFQNHAIYEGSVASLRTVPDHQPIVCAIDQNQRSLNVEPAPGVRFWLVAPLLSSREGNPGLGSGGNSRSALATCASVSPDLCP